MDHGSHDSHKAIALLKTARGQIDATIRMVEEDRYCIDVSKQVLATLALLIGCLWLRESFMRQHREANFAVGCARGTTAP